MRKNKTPEPKTWYRIEVIQTGNGYMTREHYASWRTYPGNYDHDFRQAETAVLTIDGNKNPDDAKAVVELIDTLIKQRAEISRLNDVINNFKDAQEKIMKETQ